MLHLLSESGSFDLGFEIWSTRDKVHYSKSVRIRMNDRSVGPSIAVSERDNPLSIALIVETSLGIFSLFSNYNRPIWLDEFLHYAFAGSSFRTDAVTDIRKSINGVNFGSNRGLHAARLLDGSSI